MRALYLEFASLRNTDTEAIMTTSLSFARIETRSGKRRALLLIAAVLVSAAAVAAAIEGFATIAPAKASPNGTGTTVVFTGTYANGVPVYLLPPVSIVASRKAELARMEREAQRAHATYGRADDPAHRTN
jgi:hypothetical protein